MPSILAFDTLAYSKALQNAGMEPALADLIASKQREAIADILDSRQLATKQDVQLEIEKVVSGECVSLVSVPGHKKSPRSYRRASIRKTMGKGDCSTHNFQQGSYYRHRTNNH